MAKKDGQEGAGIYGRIVETIFKRHYSAGVESFEFEREEIASTARRLRVSVPKNLGDVIYSVRSRTGLPPSVMATAKAGHEWIIEGKGRSRYAMRLVPATRLQPRNDLVAIKIPDATPEIVVAYAKGDEQALLARLRYNRMIDIFLGVTAYSLQNHLRTSVKGTGQIEIDELYVAVDRGGVQYVIPVQAKGGTDQHSVVQTMQDLAFCAEKYPHLVCRAVSAQFMSDERIALFEVCLENGAVRVVQERHYCLVPSAEILAEDLRQYRSRTEG